MEQTSEVYGSPKIFDFNILAKNQSLFVLNVPNDDMKFWKMNITY